MEDFNYVVERRCELSKKVLCRKAGEYATVGSRFHNFEVAARMDHQSPEQALWGMWKKHIVSVMDMINDCDTDIYDALLPTKYTEAYVDEKIGDLINYAMLLEGMLRRRLLECNEDADDEDECCSDSSHYASRTPVPTTAWQKLVIPLNFDWICHHCNCRPQIDMHTTHCVPCCEDEDTHSKYQPIDSIDMDEAMVYAFSQMHRGWMPTAVITFADAYRKYAGNGILKAYPDLPLKEDIDKAIEKLSPWLHQFRDRRGAEFVSLKPDWRQVKPAESTESADSIKPPSPTPSHYIGCQYCRLRFSVDCQTCVPTSPDGVGHLNSPAL